MQINLSKTKKIIGLIILLLLITVTMVYYYMFEYKVIYKINTKDKRVALTFDDGPDPRFTPKVLEILNKYHAKATFFVVGQQVEEYPDITRKIIKEGHELGDHTYSHPDLLFMNQSQIYKEIDVDKRIIEKISGKEVKWFRPPKMLYGPGTNMVVNEEGMDMVLWKIGVENHNAKTPEAMAKRVIDKVKPGWIILIHDGRLDRTKSVKALPILLQGLKDQGYKFVTLSELSNSD